MGNVTGTTRAVAFSVLDQGLSSLTNILVLVVVARLSDARQFAVFSLAYIVYSVLLGASSAYVGQAVVLDAADPDLIRTTCRSAVTFVAMTSTAVGGALAVSCALLPGATASALAVLGLVLPIVLTQDATRYCFSTLRLPQWALLSDLAWLALALLVLATRPAGVPPWQLLGLWGLSAVPALLIALALLLPRVRGAGVDLRRYLRRGYLGQRFIIEFAVGNASSQLSVLTLGVFAETLAVGALRGTTTLFGPLNVLFNASTAFGPPMLRHVPPARTVPVTAALGVLLGGVAAVWGLLLLELPVAAGRQLLGDTWPAAHALLPAAASQYVAIAAGTSALLTLRVLSPRTTLPIQVTFSLLAVAALFAGYLIDGVQGAAWGLAIGSTVKAVVLWTRVRAVRPAPKVGAHRRS